MPGASDAGSIRLLLAGPFVLRTFAFALVGRLAYGVLPLCFLFTVRDASGSLGTAAASVAALGFATLAMPIQSRLVDRYGQRRILPVYTTCYIVLLIAGALLAQGVNRPAVWLGLGLLLGLSAPALGPAMRAQWREITTEGPMRRRAYSLDAVGEESLYLVGPIVAAAVLTLGPAWVGLLLAAGLVGCGTTALVTSPHRPQRYGRSNVEAPIDNGPLDTGAAVPSRSSTLLEPRLLSLLAVMCLLGGGGAAAFVGVAALADRAGNPGLAGIVEAAMATGAVVGGVLWARFGRSDPNGLVLAALLVPVAAAHLLAGGAAPNLFLVGILLAVGTLAVSPIFVVAFTATDQAVPAAQRTEASTWVTVGANAGTAVGTALAGVLAGLGGSAPFLLAGTFVAAAAATAAVSRGRPSGGRGGSTASEDPRNEPAHGATPGG